MKLLVVDDHSTVRKMLISMYGFLFEEIMEADNGEDAVMFYKMHKPDWVLMDIKMKKMDGITATRIIKQIDKNAKIIVVTIFRDEETISEAVNAGAYDIVIKDDLTKICEIINS